MTSIDTFRLVWLLIRLVTPAVAAWYLFIERWGLENGQLIVLLTIVVLTYKFLYLRQYTLQGNERSRRSAKIYLRIEVAAFIALSVCEGTVLWAAQHKLGVPQAIGLAAIGYVPYAALTYWAMNLRIKVELLRGVESIFEDLSNEA